MAAELTKAECSHSFDFFYIKKYKEKTQVDAEDGSDAGDSFLDEQQEPRLSVTLEMHAVEKLYTMVTEKEGNVTPKVFAKLLYDYKNIENEVAMRLFDKIDWSSMSSVSWSEFCTYLQMEFSIMLERERSLKAVDFALPVPTAEFPHRDKPVAVLPTDDGLWITISSSKTRMKKKNPKQWVTGAALMPEYSKIIVTTGDREIQFYDMASFSPFCQLSGLESIPITFDYKSLTTNKCLMVYGDQMGCVNVLSFHYMGKSFRMWKKLHKHENYIPSMPIEQAVLDPTELTFMRWKVHADWVMAVKYYPETDMILSCSKDPNASLVIGRRRGSCSIPKAMREWDQMMNRKGPQSLYGCTKSRLPQDQIVYALSRGIMVFDFSKELSMVATGGADRVIRLWSCFINKKPLTKLWGHYDMITSLYLCHRSKNLFSVSADLWIKVWDVQDYTCLLTVSRQVHMVRGPLQVVAYNPKVFTLAVAGDQLGLFKIKTDDGDDYHRSHDSPVTCLLCHEELGIVLSADEGSTVKTWNLDSGCCDGLFREAHGSIGIADMTFDNTRKRIVTVGRDGSGYIWNYNIGTRVRATQKASAPITSVIYVDMHNARYIVMTGWNKRLNMYIDDTPETIPYELPLISQWHDDKVRGHTEDILSTAFSGRSQIATGSFDGNVIVWNMETSKKFYHIVVPVPEDWSEERVKADRGVSAVHFLRWRSKNRKGGNLVVGGPYGHLSIWFTHLARMPNPHLAYFNAYPEEMKEVYSVTAIDSDPDSVMMATGDSQGHVTVWDLTDYAMDERQAEIDPPRRIAVWEAHLRAVSGVKLVKGRRFVISTSSDHTVRLWTFAGHYTADAELTEREIDRYKIGLDYFARSKAVLSRKGRHLNDEVINPYSVIGTVSPYLTLRHHALQDPPQPPDKTVIDGHFRHAEKLQFATRDSETSLFPDKKGVLGGKNDLRLEKTDQHLEKTDQHLEKTDQHLEKTDQNMEMKDQQMD